MKQKTRSPFWDFNPRIFAEGFRQLRTVGILALVILCLAAALLPIGVAIETYSYLQPGETVTRSLVSFLNVHPLVLLPMYTLALIMPLMVFGFLNKRRSSDFYHAIPVNRSALFISLFASIMAWILLAVVASTAVSLVTCLCFPALFQINWSTVLPLVCSSLAGALLVTGCMSMAMCITGTIFNNLLVAALLFFGPRLLMAYVTLLLQDAVHILPDTIHSPLLDFSYNIPMGIPYSLLCDNNISEVLFRWDSILYTALIGLLWFFVSVVLFRIRGSESAERPASTPLLQHVYRLAITFIVTLIPVWGISYYVRDIDSLEATGVFLIIVLYIVAALVFCIYELITTKKPKQLLKVAKTFPLVLAADIILLIGLQVGVYSTLSFRPAASEITSLSFTDRYYDLEEDYFASRAAQVALKDETAISMTAEKLALAAEKNDPDAGIDYTNKFNSQTVTDFVVTFRTNGVTRQRLLCFTEEETAIITEAMAASTDYQAIYKLPEPSSKTTVDMWSSLQPAQSDEVYRTLCKEVNALPFEQRFDYLSTGYYPANQATVAWISVETAIGADSFTFEIPLSKAYAPQAYDLYLQYVYENAADERATLLTSIKDISAVTNDDATWEFNVILSDGETHYVNIFDNDDPEVVQAVKDIAAGVVDRTPTADDVLCYAGYYYDEIIDSDGDAWEYHSYCSYIVLNEDALEAFMQLTRSDSPSIESNSYTK